MGSIYDEIRALGLSLPKLRAMIENTTLKPNQSERQIEEFCRQSVAQEFAVVAVNSGFVPLAKRAVQGSNTRVCCGIGFPLGAVSTICKVIEIRDAISSGAEELDFVINIGKLKSKDYEYVEEEMRQIVKAAGGHLTKAILETCYLEQEEIVFACQAAVRSGVTFVKTSTGFGSEGAKENDVRLMRKAVEDKCRVKAAGGIRSLEDTIKMIKAGAERIGTSSGLKIISEFKEVFHE